MLPRPGKQIFAETKRMKASGCGSNRLFRYHINSDKALMNHLCRYDNLQEKEKHQKKHCLLRVTKFTYHSPQRPEMP